MLENLKLFVGTLSPQRRANPDPKVLASQKN